MTDAMTGPFETEREARELPAVQAVYEAFDADPGVGKMAPHTRRMLIAACDAAGVELGAFDRRILSWLSGFEPETAAVIAALITRAHEAGRAESRGLSSGGPARRAGPGCRAIAIRAVSGYVALRVNIRKLIRLCGPRVSVRPRQSARAGV
jgi:hypothetical protein